MRLEPKKKKKMKRDFPKRRHANAESTGTYYYSYFYRYLLQLKLSSIIGALFPNPINHPERLWPIREATIPIFKAVLYMYGQMVD